MGRKGYSGYNHHVFKITVKEIYLPINFYALDLKPSPIIGSV